MKASLPHSRFQEIVTDNTKALLKEVGKLLLFEFGPIVITVFFFTGIMNLLPGSYDQKYLMTVGAGYFLGCYVLVFILFAVIAVIIDEVKPDQEKEENG